MKDSKELMDDNLFVNQDDNDTEEELFEHFSITVDKGQSQVRVDKFLTARLENSSRNRIQTAADSGSIIVNGVAVKSSYKVKPCDKISIVMPYPVRKVEIIPQNIPLNIIYEDEWLIVVNKEAGMVVHPGHGNYDGTLVNALTYHLQGNDMVKNSDMRAGLVHRIDKNTSGLLVVAKDELTHAYLAKQFFDHSIDRKYVALVWGSLKEDEGTITGNIARSTKDRLKMAVFADETIGKHAITHYRVLERFDYVTLVECKLETGRTHQIRVHMEHIGHPLFADERYGGDKILKGTTFSKYTQFVNNNFSIMPRQALHAKSLGFTHPKTKERMFFESDLTNDFLSVIDRWRQYTNRNNCVE
ncbi:MAG: RluA family pseudouridine synthase [Rikenellaceae bacterium]